MMHLQTVFAPDCLLWHLFHVTLVADKISLGFDFATYLAALRLHLLGFD